MESFELGVDKEILTKAVVSNSGMESSMITDRDIRKFYNDKEYTIGGKLVATNVVGGSVVGVDGNLGNAAALMYGRKNKC